MRKPKLFLPVLAAIAMLAPSQLLAIVPVVKTVPWDPANFAAPHFTYAGKAITLKGTSNQQGANFVYDWDFGDGSPHATGAVTNMYNVSATHTYVGATGTTWTGVLKVTDTNTGDNASSTYPVIMAASDLTSNVNVAIDEGLWFLHINMNRYVSGPLDFGDWSSSNCSFVCYNGAYGVTATNLQAMEVNGHFENGPAADPYTEDVARGLKAMIAHLTTFNTAGNFTVPGGCGTPPCTINPDGNGNGIATYLADGTGQYEYQSGMVMDALVATGNPAGIAVTGPANVIGKSYGTIVQDMVDQYSYCVARGNPGGAWIYGCNGGWDNSVSQWAAIGIIGAERGFGSVVDPNLKGWNKVWLGNSEAGGVFGYNSTSPVWGPYATTPSGMVQLAMDGVGRGNAAWDTAETFIRDNFGNAPSNSNVSLKAYYYGMFSFTKAMLLHNPAGVLTPITLLKSSTSGVSPIDWYAAQTTAGDPTDGVARWLVGQQNAAGYWYNTLEINTTGQWPFSTGFAIIMLRRTVFTPCVTNLGGRGTAAGRAAARVDLTWSGLGGASQYTVFRGTATGGPYSQIGTTSITAYSDTAGLSNGNTYYYVLQPDNTSGGEICQSNEAKITVPTR